MCFADSCSSSFSLFFFFLKGKAVRPSLLPPPDSGDTTRLPALSDDESDEDVEEEVQRYSKLASIESTVNERLNKLCNGQSSETDPDPSIDTAGDRSRPATPASPTVPSKEVVHPHLDASAQLSTQQWEEQSLAVEVMANTISTVDGTIKHKANRLIL